jgi:hypothetical protein
MGQNGPGRSTEDQTRQDESGLAAVAEEPDLGGPGAQGSGSKLSPGGIAIGAFDQHELDIRFLHFLVIHDRLYLQYKCGILRSNTGNTGYLAFNGACIINGRSVCSRA